ncbi:hypothetical protein Q5H93_00850 [Hymenobacter sp. ASUV-10]|uniref:Type 1 periplasmic binding fold superfamily protein n=1 Tax=Hymenobacter aranciens TaxID=3063996 RepID=A0ABT9B4R1_9BACT|nr:hypothetical protein [Hymenobacter sp. ASUV-10]MDO7873262.1 hypothetical protein [Hymenobacter sp. ASUV-10]
MKITFFRPFALILLAAPFFTACDDDKDPAPVDENEIITTVTYTLTPVGGGTPVSITYRDPDGDQGSQPGVITGALTLAAGTSYTGALTLLDETKTPAGNTTADILAEADEHLFVYTVNPAGLLTIARTDKDSKNLEVGLATSVQTRATAGTGTLNIVLRHQPGVKDGTATPGSSDVDVNFPVTVQ